MEEALASSPYIEGLTNPEMGQKKYVAGMVWPSENEVIIL